MKKILIILVSFLILFPAFSFAASQEEIMQKIESLSKEIENLKQQMEEVKTQKQLQDEENMKQVNELKDKMKEMDIQEKFQDKRVASVEEKSEEVAEKWSWLTIGGEYRFRFDSLRGKVHDHLQYNPFGSMLVPNYPMPGINSYFFASPTKHHKVENDSVMFNRFRLKLSAQATENIKINSRLSMYKTWGHDTVSPVQGSFFADRAMGPFDGTVGYVPEDNKLRVDYAFATWSNILETPTWFSIGRRPSTGGVPTNIRQNTEKIGTAGVAGHLIDYAFDGLTMGYAPYIEALPGAYLKFCYGRGFDSGFETDLPGRISQDDTDFIGIFVDPIYTDNLNVEIQWIKGFNIFNTLPDGMTQPVDTGLMAGGSPSGSFIEVKTPVTRNLGDIDQFGVFVDGKIKDVGIGDLNLFVSGALSITHPNDNLFSLPFVWVDMNGDGIVDSGEVMNGGFGLLYDEGAKDRHTGKSVYLGARYDIKKTGTKIGLEYNYGSKYWITFTPAADDIWTSKLGTRGSVYEAYIIQELPETPVSRFGKAFVRLGYQYYKFQYTGSNNWVGEPKKIEDLNMMDPSGTQMLAPLEHAHDIYLTFDVAF